MPYFLIQETATELPALLDATPKPPRGPIGVVESGLRHCTGRSALINLWHRIERCGADFTPTVQNDARRDGLDVGILGEFRYMLPCSGSRQTSDVMSRSVSSSLPSTCL